MIKNYMEIIVDEVFNEVKSLYKECLNDNCVHDIKSIALNNLPSYYFNHNVGEYDKKAFLLDRQRRITVLAQITEAADTVCSSCKKA